MSLTIKTALFGLLFAVAFGANAHSIESVDCISLLDGKTACWLPSAAKAKCQGQVERLLEMHGMRSAAFTNFSYYPYDPQNGRPKFPVREVVNHGDVFVARYDYDFGGKMLSITALQYPTSKLNEPFLDKLKRAMQARREKLVEDQNWRMTAIRENLASLRKTDESAADSLARDYEEGNSARLDQIDAVFGAAALKLFQECHPTLHMGF